MENGSVNFPWRGYVNTITYDVDLSSKVDEQLVDRIVNALIEQRFFSGPVDEYYQAMVSALDSDATIALDDQDEEATRDLLTRLVHGLDHRKPWPVHPFYCEDRSEWTDFEDTPLIGRTLTSAMSIVSKLNRSFSSVKASSVQLEIMILRLRSGETVVLRSTPDDFAKAGVDILSRSDPAATLAALRELTGIEAELI